MEILEKVCGQSYSLNITIITKTLEESKCPTRETWFNKLWNSKTKEYYAAIKNHALKEYLMPQENIHRVK